jgi:alkylhydroperoxidase/carboxymuconolactone decarboxylase family protein
VEVESKSGFKYYTYIHKKANHQIRNIHNPALLMSNHYYNAADLSRFGNIGEFQKDVADKFFAWYGEVFKDGALSAKEKSLIALAVAHAVQCPYCIDAYSSDAYQKGYSEAQMMEAVHVAASIRGGATLVHGVQMMNKVREIGM